MVTPKGAWNRRQSFITYLTDPGLEKRTDQSPPVYKPDAETDILHWLRVHLTSIHLVID